MTSLIFSPTALLVIDTSKGIVAAANILYALGCNVSREDLVSGRICAAIVQWISNKLLLTLFTFRGFRYLAGNSPLIFRFLRPFMTPPPLPLPMFCLLWTVMWNGKMWWAAEHMQQWVHWNRNILLLTLFSFRGFCYFTGNSPSILRCLSPFVMKDKLVSGREWKC